MGKSIQHESLSPSAGKEDCFGLSAELVVDKALELRFAGGVYRGNIKPAPFLHLTLKMLQIQLEKGLIVEFVKKKRRLQVYLRVGSTLHEANGHCN